jgi:hypothetical protein
MVFGLSSNCINLFSPVASMPWQGASQNGNDAVANPWSTSSGFPNLQMGNYFMQLMLMESMLRNMVGSQLVPGFDSSFSTNTNLAQLKNVYNGKTGKKLAQIAYENAAAQNTRGRCLHGVRTALNRSGLVIGGLGIPACGAAQKLASSKNFREVRVSKDQLNHLPAGCVVVYNKCAGHPYGHITVSLGNGKAASDHVENAVAGQSQLYNQYRVFVPASGLSCNA